jgi:hypothetical protein
MLMNISNFPPTEYPRKNSVSTISKVHPRKVMLIIDGPKEIDPEKVLHLEASVVCTTQPTKTVFICEGCILREVTPITRRRIILITRENALSAKKITNAKQINVPLHQVHPSLPTKTKK